MTATDARAALEGAAEAIQESARGHKRAEFHHRKQARNLMRQLDELRAACDALGIRIRIDTDRR